ncbi:MAG: 4'-phosphopantetheinyl transferase superfamily protein [Polaribacter sp.]
MPKIGNDIIDLNLAETQSNWKRTGFLEKQFTKREQQEINDSENPFLKVWLFWSLKEAAYKCYTQKIEKRFFAPQKFECYLKEDNKGIVIFENHKFYTSSFLDDAYIHTIAEDALVENSDEVRMFIGIGSPNLVDKNIKLKLAEETGISALEIEKKKTKVGAPLFYHQEKLLTNSCSISHYGNYGAFAFSLEK